MKTKLFTKLFWVDASERAIATAAQTVLTIVTIFLPAVALTNQQDLQIAVTLVVQTLPLILLAGVGGAAYSYLKSIVAAYWAGTDTASLVVDSKPLNK